MASDKFHITTENNTFIDFDAIVAIESGHFIFAINFGANFSSLILYLDSRHVSIYPSAGSCSSTEDVAT